MSQKLEVGMDFILPPEVSGGATSEVFTVYKVVTQSAIPAVYNRDGSVKEIGSEAFTTVLLSGVASGQQVAISIGQLADLGWPVSARKAGEQ